MNGVSSGLSIYQRQVRLRRAMLLTTSAMVLGLVLAPAPGRAQTVNYANGDVKSAPIVLTGPGVLSGPAPGTTAQQSGAISGAFGVTKTGGGYLQLSGANTYSGGTDVQGGFLELLSDQALGTGGVSLADGTGLSYGDGRSISNVLVLNDTNYLYVNAGSATQSGAVTGLGRLVKRGVGTLVLDSVVNDYAGGTEIVEGTIAADADNALGTGEVTMHAGTTLEYGMATLDNDLVLAGPAGSTVNLRVASGGHQVGVIDDLGAGVGLRKIGAGVLSVSAANRYTGATFIDEGTVLATNYKALGEFSAVTIADGAKLRLGSSLNVGSLSGGGTVEFTPVLSLNVGENNSSSTYSGTFTGQGSLYKFGDGTVALDGDSRAWQGSLYSVAGELWINGRYDDALLDGSRDATIGGAGTVEAINVNSLTLIRPGAHAGAIGTLTVRDWANLSGGILEVDVNSDGDGDRIDAGGLVSIVGTDLRVAALAGSYNPSRTYTILTSADRIDGTFEDVTANLAYLTPEVIYGAQEVQLKLTRNRREFADVGALTWNQAAAAHAAEALGAGNIIHDTVVAGSEAEARQAFDALSGEIHASVGTALVAQTQLVQDVLLNRMRQPFSTLVDDSFTALGYVGDRATAAPAGGWVATPWAQAFGGFQQFNSNGNAATLTQGTGGVLFGVDGTLDSRFRIGVAGGVSGSHVSGDTGPSAADISSAHLAAYGAADLDALALRFGAAYSWNSLNTQRDVTFRSFADQTLAKYGAQTGQVFGEVGYKVTVGQVMLEPFGGLAVVGVGADNFREDGGAAALVGTGLSQTMAFTTLGLRGDWTLNAGETGILSGRGGLGWRHAFNADPATHELSFASGGAAFQVAGVPVAADSFVLEAGLDYQGANGLSLGLNYAGQLAGAAQSHAIKGALGFSF